MPNPPRYTGTITGAYVPPATMRERNSGRCNPQRSSTVTQEYTTQQLLSTQDYYNTLRDAWAQYSGTTRFVRNLSFYQAQIPEPQQEETPMFNIGDSVYYRSERYNKNFYGIIISKGRDNRYAVAFEQDFKTTYGYLDDVYHIDAFYIQLGSREPELPVEQKVAKRCKKLWNNSNWVIKHPHMAY